MKDFLIRNLLAIYFLLFKNIFEEKLPMKKWILVFKFYKKLGNIIKFQKLCTE